jgi:hypothetical protein
MEKTVVDRLNMTPIRKNRHREIPLEVILVMLVVMLVGPTHFGSLFGETLLQNFRILGIVQDQPHVGTVPPEPLVLRSELSCSPDRVDDVNRYLAARDVTTVVSNRIVLFELLTCWQPRSGKDVPNYVTQAVGGKADPIERVTAGRILIELNETGKAFEQWRQASDWDILLALSGVNAYNLGDVRKALLLFDWAEQTNSRVIAQKSAMYTILCDHYFARPTPRDLDAALWNCQKVAAARPDVGSLETLGKVYFERNEYDAAFRTFEQLKRIAPQAANGYMWLGTLYRKQGQDAQAEREWLDATLVDSDYPWPHILLAELYLDQGNDDLALAQLQATLALGNPPASEQAMKILTQIDEK